MTERKILGDVYPCPFDDCAYHSRCCGAGHFGHDEQFVPEIKVEREKDDTGATLRGSGDRKAYFICQSWRKG